MKLLLRTVLAVFLVLATLAYATALTTNADIRFGSGDNPLTRSNPEADEDEDFDIATPDVTLSVTNNQGSDITVTDIRFEAGGQSKYTGQESAFNMSFSTTSFSLTSSASQDVVVRGRVPAFLDATADTDNDGDIGDVEAERVGTIILSFTAINGSAMSTSVPVFMFGELMIDADVEIEIEGTTYDISDDEIEEIRPGDDVRICVDVSNEFDGSDDNVDMEVTVNIDTDSNDFDPDDNSDDQDVDADDEERFCFDMDIDSDVEDGDDFSVEIEVIGEDDNNADHTVMFDFDVEFESPQGEVDIESVQLNPNAVCPGDTANLDFRIENVGSDDQDFVRVQVTQSNLGINEIVSGISLEAVDERDNDYRDSIVLRIPENARAGDYNVRFVLFYEDEDGDDATEFQDSLLTVRDCSFASNDNSNSGSSNTGNTGNSNSGGSDSNDIVVQQPTSTGTVDSQQTTTVTSTTPTVVARPVSSGSNPLYIVGLVVLGLVLLGAIAYLVMVLVRK